MINFDSAPTVYWFLGYILAGVVIVSTFYKKLPVSIFVLLSIALLTFMRLPVLVFNRELNPDESQMLSHAITLHQDPVYWRSVDGTTIGPLDNYLLVIPRLFGFQIDYTSGRVMGLLCVAGALLFLFFTMRNWFGGLLARRMLLIPLLFLSFTQEVDFVHYSSEQLPVFLLAWAIWILSRLGLENKNFVLNNYTLGFVAGVIPFAKLQAVPQAIVLVLSACWLCYNYFRQTKKFRPMLMLIAGGITFPLITFIWAWANNVLFDLVDFYLLGNVIYAGGNNNPPIPVQFFKILNLSSDFKAFTLVLLVPIFAALVKMVFDIRKSGNYTVPITLLILLLSSIYAVTKSGNDFIHYLNFCIIPWTLLAAYGLDKVSKWVLVFPAFLLLWFSVNDAIPYLQERKLNNFISVNATELAQNTVVKELKKYTRSQDYMVVWGWQCVYYVEAQLAQGTAENHSERSIFKHNMLEKYRSRYFSDIQRTKPAVFLDAVGKNSFWVQDKKTQGFENYPILAQYINLNYKFLGTFDGTRLYIRKDRL